MSRIKVDNGRVEENGISGRGHREKFWGRGSIVCVRFFKKMG